MLPYMKRGEAYLTSKEKRRFDIFVSGAASPANALALAVARLTFRSDESLLLR